MPATAAPPAALASTDASSPPARTGPTAGSMPAAIPSAHSAPTPARHGGPPRMHRHPCFPRVAFALTLAGGLALAAAPAAESPPPPPAGLVAALKGHTQAVYSVAFTPDGRHVVTGSFDNTLKVWDAADGKEVKTFGGPAGHQNLVLGVAVSPDG